MNIVSKEILDAENEKRLAFTAAQQDVIKKIVELNIAYTDALENDEVKTLIQVANEKASIVDFANWKDELEQLVEKAKETKKSKIK